MNFETHWLGLTAFDKSEQLQHAWADRVRAEDEIHILGLEHQGVVTLGKRASVADDLVWNESELRHHQIEIQQIDRGGQATLHSRGQLVIYPILPLNRMNIGVRSYVDLLQDSTIELLQRYGIKASRGSEPGIHTESGKIAFCGIRVERGATRHGVSLNVQNDLNLFAGIHSCGHSKALLDSMGNYRSDLELEVLFGEWTEIFRLKSAEHARQ